MLPAGKPALMSGAIPSSVKEQDEPAPKRRAIKLRSSAGRDPDAARVAAERQKLASDASPAAAKGGKGLFKTPTLLDSVVESSKDSAGRPAETFHYSESSKDNEEDDLEPDFEPGVC